MKAIKKMFEMDRVVNQQLEVLQNTNLTMVYALVCAISFLYAGYNRIQSTYLIMGIDLLLAILSATGIVLNRKRIHVPIFRFLYLFVLFWSFVIFLVLGCNHGTDMIWLLVVSYPIMAMIDLKLGFLCGIGWQIILFLIYINPFNKPNLWMYETEFNTLIPWIYLLAFLVSTHFAVQFRKYYYYYLLNENELGAKTNIDELTGLHNLQGFYSKIEIISDTAVIAFAMIDINGLEEISKTKGKNVADKVLVKAADLFKHEFREKDYISYMGNNEISIVLESFREDNYDVFAKKVNAINEKLQKESSLPKASISVGIAFSKNGYSGSLFIEAENAKNKSKQDNVVCIIL